MSLPEPVRKRLSTFSRTVFTDNNRTGPENSGEDSIPGEGATRRASYKDGDDGTVTLAAGFPELRGKEAEPEPDADMAAKASDPNLTSGSSLVCDLYKCSSSSSQDDLAVDGKYPCYNEIVSNLPLQMSLYFNLCFFPFWWVSSVVMLHLKYPILTDYYKFILVTVIILTTLIEIIRLYLGYMGNLQEKVPELAGFWLLSLLLQLPLILFLLLNEGLKIQPLERAVHIIFVTFLVIQVTTAFVALKRMVNQLATRFHLHEFDRLDDHLPPDDPAWKKRRVEAPWVIRPPMEEMCSTSIGWGSAVRA